MDFFRSLTKKFKVVMPKNPQNDRVPVAPKKKQAAPERLP